MSTITRRHSKFVDAVKLSLAYFGHASNAQLTDDIRRSYPHISDTTIHRITQRLYEDGVITLAPPTPEGAMVYDINTTLHDHFSCSSCGAIRDIAVPKACRQMMRYATGNCRVDGPLLATGTCETCLK